MNYVNMYSLYCLDYNLTCNVVFLFLHFVLHICNNPVAFQNNRAINFDDTESYTERFLFCF